MGMFKPKQLEDSPAADNKLENQNTKTHKVPCMVKSLMQISTPTKLIRSGEVFEVSSQLLLDELLSLKSVEVQK